MLRGRLGVVLPLPAPVAHEIDGLRRALGDRRVDAVVPHVTLVAPVNVAPPQLDAALAVVRDAAAKTPPVSVVLGPMATFWPATPVVYLAVHGDVGAIERLHHALEPDPWARPTTWEFVPHVTIAHDVPGEHIPAALTAFAAYRAEATLATVRVMREEIDGSWAPLEDVALGGRRVVGRGGLEIVLDLGAAPDQEAMRRLGAVWGRAAVPFGVTARREGAVVGAAAGVTDEELWLDRLVVDPAARRQGVGRQLLREVEALGASRGCRQAFTVCPADAAAVGWLSMLGWRRDVDLPAWRAGRAFLRLTRPL